MTETVEAAPEDTAPQTLAQKLMMSFLLHYVTILGIVLLALWGLLWLFLFSFTDAGMATLLSLVIPAAAGMVIVLILASRGIEHLLAVPAQDISEEVRDSIMSEFEDSKR